MGLVNRTLIVTRENEQFARELRDYGANALHYPCIQIIPPANTRPLDDGLRALCFGMVDTLIITSVQTVRVLYERFVVLKLPIPDVRVVAVGQKTADKIVSLFPRWHIMTILPHAQAILDVAPILGTWVLMPHSDLSDTSIADDLCARGVDMWCVEAYQTIIGTGGIYLRDYPLVDGITFFSPSAVTNFIQRATSEGIEPTHILNIPAFCIGQTTAQRATDAGFLTIHTANHTQTSLITCLEEYFAS